MLGLCSCIGFSLVSVIGGSSLTVVCGLLTEGASLVAEHRLWSTWAPAVAVCGFSSCGSRASSTGSIFVAHGLICSVACGIFPDQGLNLCLLNWQVNSLLLIDQGNLISFYF